MILLVLLGLPALLFGLTAVFYLFAAWAEGLFPGGGAVASILSIIVLMVFFSAGLLTLGDRKWGAAMQDRIGPNRANIGHFKLAGLFHFVADAFKMLTKEDFAPAGADKRLFKLSPAMVFVPTLCLFAVLPVAPPVELLGHRVSLQVASPDFGILYVFAFSSLAVYGVAIAGWSSNNKLGMLGGVRAASQLIGYEVALGLSVIGVIAAFSNVRVEKIAELQGLWLWGGGNLGIPAWGILLQPLGFVLFFTAAFAETRRAPFDLPEGESEIVGFFLEHSGMRFGLFMFTEYIEVVVLAGVTASLFFGGWQLPFGEDWLRAHLDGFWVACLQGTAFWLKVVLLAWLQLLIRWTLPRFRYDQVQRLGWKILLHHTLLQKRCPFFFSYRDHFFVIRNF
jgi:NADH-quinone oxidoreductase subunit H